MPLPATSWFYKLRRKRGGAAAADWVGKPRCRETPMAMAAAVEAAAPPCSPNRASYYFPSTSRDRRLPPSSPVKDNHRLRDTHFPPRSPQPNDIVFDVVAVSSAARRFDGLLDAMPELKLRPILTRPAPGTASRRKDGGGGDDGGASDSGAASPTARVRRRLHAKAKPSVGGRRKGRPAAPLPPAARRRRRWLYESLLVVKESADPEEDFLESMAEMIAENDDDLRSSPRGLEELLACYLALNDAEHHRAIVAAFRRAWLDAADHNKQRRPPR